VAAGALFYLSLPLARAFRRPRRLTSIPLIPIVMAVRDLSKAAGFLAGVSRWARRPGRPSAGDQTGR
jgi:hypothetical protein